MSTIQTGCIRAATIQTGCIRAAKIGAFDFTLKDPGPVKAEYSQPTYLPPTAIERKPDAFWEENFKKAYATE